VARYILFAGEDYYPKGGAHDIVGGFNDLGEAIAAGRACEQEWWHLLDTEKGDIYTADKAKEPPRDPYEDKDPSLTKRLQEMLAERRAQEELQRQARDDEFNRRFADAGDDEVAVRRCKHAGHQPIPDDRKRRKGAKVVVSCACGRRLFSRQGDGTYERISDEKELWK
jgi:hypothetical protein